MRMDTIFSIFLDRIFSLKILLKIEIFYLRVCWAKIITWNTWHEKVKLPIASWLSLKNLKTSFVQPVYSTKSWRLRLSKPITAIYWSNSFQFLAQKIFPLKHNEERYEAEEFCQKPLEFWACPENHELLNGSFIPAAWTPASIGYFSCPMFPADFRNMSLNQFQTAPLQRALAQIPEAAQKSKPQTPQRKREGRIVGFYTQKERRSKIRKYKRKIHEWVRKFGKSRNTCSRSQIARLKARVDGKFLKKSQAGAEENEVKGLLSDAQVVQRNRLMEMYEDQGDLNEIVGLALE